jgi:hypothetical protein
MSFFDNLATTIGTIGTTFTGVWNATHQGGGGTTTPPSPTVNTNPKMDSAQLVQYVLLGGAGVALLGALFMLFGKHKR